jgi:PAS domain-containing protein
VEIVRVVPENTAVRSAPRPCDWFLRRDLEAIQTVRVRRDGVRIHVSVRLSPIIDPEGGIIGVSNIARDFTEQKRMEDQLFVEEDRAQVMLHSIGMR